MEVLQVERVGGIAGMGGPGAHIRSRGQIALETLSKADRQSVLSLFTSRARAKPSPMRDGFSYRLSRTGASGTETVEVPEALLPPAVAACVKDELV